MSGQMYNVDGIEYDWINLLAQLDALIRLGRAYEDLAIPKLDNDLFWDEYNRSLAMFPKDWLKEADYDSWEYLYGETEEGEE